MHTRLVPGFVIDTKLEGDVRIVTFGNGMVVREPIVTIDEAARRLVWSSQGGRTTHYNAAVQVLALANGHTTITWIADFLPNSAAEAIGAAMDLGAATMKKTLDKIGE